MTAVRNLDALEDFVQLYIHGGHNKSLLFHLVRMFRTGCRFRATEDKDRIYALLSFSDKHAMSPAVAAVDYLDPTPVRLFVDVAIHFLHDARVRPPLRLDFLAHAGLGCSSKLPLPSWVPDWTVSDLPSTPFLGLEGFCELSGNDGNIYRYCNAIAEMKTYGDFDPVTSPMHKDTMKALEARVVDLRKAFYKAGLPETEEAQFEVVRSPSKVLLKITGHSAGHVVYLGTPFGAAGTNDMMYRGGSIFLNPAAFLPLDWRPLADKHGRAYLRLPIASLCEAFARTLVGDLSRTQFDMKVDGEAPVRATRTDIADFITSYEEVLAKYFRKPTPLEDIFSTSDKRAYDISFLLRANSVIRHVCAGRVFGITDQGLMGLFPHGTQIGDAVAVFYGAPVPFNLRPCSRHTAAAVSTHNESAVGGDVHYQLV
jgi:hypothetical protein